MESPEFDSPFVVLPDGVMADSRTNHAPSVFHDDHTDVYVDGQGWEPLTGYTGQYGYRGAVMHASEQWGGRLETDVLAQPGVYVLVVVNVLPTEDDEDPEPAGWAVLRKV